MNLPSHNKLQSLDNSLHLTLYPPPHPTLFLTRVTILLNTVFFISSVYIFTNIFLYLFGCTGSLLQDVGSSVFVLAHDILSCVWALSCPTWGMREAPLPADSCCSRVASILTSVTLCLFYLLLNIKKYIFYDVYSFCLTSLAHRCLVTKLCLTLLRPMDCSPPGSSVHGILQARILEWIANSFSRGSSPPRDWTSVSCTGRQILYRWATREALTHYVCTIHLCFCL